MTPETRQCQNCKQNFVIEPDDFAFYEKMKVPAPTFCPDCRRQRRFAWRNERTLYKRACDMCRKDVIALYPKDSKFPVYCNACWFSDKWDPLTYGAAYDPSKPFFRQFKELSEKVPRLAIWVQQSTDSEYTNQSYSNKNVYLSFALRDSEDVAYCCRAVELKQCIDDTYTHHSELLYQCVDTDKSYRSQFLEEADGCVESAFLSNARNCQNCFGGANLRSASNVFFGEALSKEAYEEKLAGIDKGSRKVLEELKKKLAELKKRSIFRFATLTNATNVTGNHLSNAKNCHFVFDGFELENARYSSWVFTSKEISDCYGMGGSEFIYEGIGVEEVNNIKFATVTDSSHHVEYTDMCSASSNLFGCVGLRNKEYYILNKPYAKEEYEKKVAEIIAHMNASPYTDKRGRVYRYGEFFPAELSPFAYNETVAQENYPLKKEDAEAQGYFWREPEAHQYATTLTAENVPDNIKEVSDSITNETIQCAHEGKCNDQCSTAFRITPLELRLHRALNMPLPQLCPNCRHYERLAQRNPLKLWRRKCQCAGGKSEDGVYTNTAVHSHKDGRCINEFETSYAPERPETIYCEQCYNAEVI
ncbi:MAG: hypothetical protein V1885_03410 [Candidatus Brennerbacteria bacterium]